MQRLKKTRSGFSAAGFMIVIGGAAAIASDTAKADSEVVSR
jgi:hypothetical protein